MHTIIAIALVSAVQALLQCSDYCKLISSSKPMKWRPDCNCSIMKNDMLQINALLGDTSNLLYDADASSIYYEPAESYRLSFLGQPFYLINPAPKISKQSLPQSNIEEREKDWTFTKNYKRAHISKIKIETEELPLYLDIDINNAQGQGKSISHDFLKNKVEDFQRTENDLMKCLDLNVLYISRTNGVSGDNIETFNSKNMEHFGGMSDSELMAALKDKCDLPASVIEQSLQEVKDNWPKKNISTARLKNNVYKEIISKTQHKDMITFPEANTTDTKRIIANDSKIGDPIIDYIKNATFLHEDVRNNSRTDATSTPINDSNISLSHTNYENIFNDQDDLMTTNNYYGITTVKTINESLSKNISDYQERTALQEEKSNDNNLFTTDSLVLSFNETEKEITSTYPVSSTENVPINDLNLIIVSQYPPELKEKNLDELNLDMISVNPIETLLRTSSNDSEDKTSYRITTDYADVLNNNFINKENTTSATINDMTTTRIDRTQYLEGEYQIQKIISKELSNNTLLSKVDGNETIPNFDFDVYSNVSNNSFENNSQTFDDVTSKHILDSEFIKSSEFTTASNVEQIITDDENIQGFSSDELKINGELYFLYGHSKIPARFVQNSDGKINVAIDGAAICDELYKRGEKKSLLLTSLCNSVQSHN